MFAGLEKRKPDCFAVKQYKKYKLASGVVCYKRLLNQAVGKALRTHSPVSYTHLAYITAALLGGDSENAEQAARYCRAV